MALKELDQSLSGMTYQTQVINLKKRFSYVARILGGSSTFDGMLLLREHSTDRRVFFWSLPTHTGKNGQTATNKLDELLNKAELLNKTPDDHYLLGITNAQMFKGETKKDTKDRLAQLPEILLVRAKQLSQFFAPSIGNALQTLPPKKANTQTNKKKGPTDKKRKQSQEDNKDY